MESASKSRAMLRSPGRDWSVIGRGASSAQGNPLVELRAVIEYLSPESMERRRLSGDSDLRICTAA